MAYKPTPTLTAEVGEQRAWSVDTSAGDTLLRIAEMLERIELHLAIITGMDLKSGES